MTKKICRLVRDKDEPFGGIQVVMSGDFLQLPPINRPNSLNGGFIVNSQVWQELNPVVLYLDWQIFLASARDLASRLSLIIRASITNL